MNAAQEQERIIVQEEEAEVYDEHMEEPSSSPGHATNNNNNMNGDVASASDPRVVPLHTQKRSRSSSPQFDTDSLEKFGHWLMQIPRNDVIALKQTPAYSNFVCAFEQLANAHCDLLNSQQQQQQNDVTKKASQSSSFLQHLLIVDDVVLRIFEFLSCQCLMQVGLTCSRFHSLARTSATQQTFQLQQDRQITNVFQLLRAKEQMEGTIITTAQTVQPTTTAVVPVPMLGLRRRVLVTHAGDEEYNGIYYCTGTNGNGFVFTKPRMPPQRYTADTTTTTQEDHTTNNAEASSTNRQAFGRLLQCIIAKRFSNETILWYMSKEVVEDDDELSQSFSFWSKLMVLGDASEDQCQYPSQTSILSRNENNEGLAWQPLEVNRLLQPPIVELLD